jgi:DNA adenine methylase
MRPFLRWAGGKRWLARSKAFEINTEMRLVEPFVGGGALFFAHDWKSALLADTNRSLVNAYQHMKESPSQLHSTLLQHFDNHSSDRYYEVRARFADESLQDAADFVYLNRSCFNGLFRVNLSGRFNVPLGSKVYEIRDLDEFLAWSERLKSSTIQLQDFELTIDSSGEGDLVFADPPYTVNHNGNGFIEYNVKIFTWDDQIRLKSALIRARSRGASFVVTNADHKAIHDLYDGYNVITVSRGSEMAGSNLARGRTSEAIIFSV